ncbi:MAG: hypothetical protein LBL48_08510 [Azoarcus sp.]|jgi:hypothetical protein|nr:hypothetical protein [Azoarcus sp.]
MMDYPKIVLSDPKIPLPLFFLKKTFSALFDTRSREWSDNEWINLKTIELLDAGCVFFVCFGSDSESVHDKIDDIIVRRGRQSDILTTFHEDEDLEDVFDFFLMVALKETKFGLLLTDDQTTWKSIITCRVP